MGEREKQYFWNIVRSVLPGTLDNCLGLQSGIQTSSGFLLSWVTTLLSGSLLSYDICLLKICQRFLIMLFLRLFAWVNLTVRQHMSSIAHVIYSVYSGMLSIMLSSVESVDFECVFFSLAVKVICKFCTCVYVPKKLHYFLRKDCQTCSETAGLQSQTQGEMWDGEKRQHWMEMVAQAPGEACCVCPAWPVHGVFIPWRTVTNQHHWHCSLSAAVSWHSA